jgi:hypothetical protein
VLLDVLIHLMRAFWFWFLLPTRSVLHRILCLSEVANSLFVWSHRILNCYWEKRVSPSCSSCLTQKFARNKVESAY